MFHAEIELTNHCNTRCLQCPHEAMSRPKGRMDWPTFTTVVGKIREHVRPEKYSLSFSGMGEPLLNPEIFRFIQHVSGEAYTGFATNGAALTESNVRNLIAAGLDVIYVSFNGDDPALYAQMMGGLSFERVRSNLRRTLQLAAGTRLRIKANISVTRANRAQLTPLCAMLEREGVASTTLSLCHSRGGNLRDTEVFDTPAPPEDDGRCDVLKNTLFVDWRGKVFICDHDIHGEHGLGDLVREPLSTVLDRRRALVERGLDFKICGECHDLLKFGFHPLESGAGGILSDWIYDIYRSGEERLPDATPSLKWLFEIYKKEDRTDRLVNRLLAIEKSLQQQLATERTENAQPLAALQAELAVARSENVRKDQRIHELDARLRDELPRQARRIDALDHRLQAIRRSRWWRLRRRTIKLLELFGGRDDQKD